MRNETQFVFIAGKYYQFSSEVPATYFVAQWVYKSASDIFGHVLEGGNDTPGSRPGGIRGGSNYFALGGAATFADLGLALCLPH